MFTLNKLENNISVGEVFLINLPLNILVSPHGKNSKTCSFCQSDLEIEEGVMFYDKKWFHNQCWTTFENSGEY